ncbi:hypothetical protein QCM77_10930 [Bradyrhizobium sp. SSUT18]|uniref:hypothetical protein n=1 Tax=Bradyrhizobium sp. SSUT18 TaxID=3040602 RepID=UPI002448B5F5|nr:hypothetical protein [Bradyrhizobium sp. SSUT18]MDH2400447.1 hypothetical protein [Bradyrhizobium sp. SSUT18]
MPKADSDDSTTPSGDTDKKVASSRKTPPNERTGKAPPDKQTETSSMRKTATANATPKSLALQPSRPSTFPHRRPKAVQDNSAGSADPLLALFDLYREQTTALGRATFIMDCFDKDAPAPHHRRPRVSLSPQRYAFNAADIDAFFDDTPDFAEHIAATWIGAQSREELHEELRSQIEAFKKVWASISYEQAKEQQETAQAAEHETLMRIENSLPITMEGCAALACFLLSMITEGDETDDSVEALHCRNLIKALSRLSGKPTPDVAGYVHSLGYDFE